MRRLTFSVFMIVIVLGAVSAQDGLVANYPFNGNAEDASGNGFHGNIHGCVFGSDKDGNAESAIIFNGIDDYVEIPYNESFQPTDQLTVATYIKLPGPVQSKDLISNSEYGGWALEMLNSNQISASIIRESDYSGYSANFYLTSINAEEWFHAAFTYDGISLSLYINGALVVATDAPGTIGYAYQNSMILGAEAGSANTPIGNYFSGSLDEVRIYNYALTASEIEQLVHPTEEELIAYFPFNGNANDASGNGYDGVVHEAVSCPNRFGGPSGAFYFDGNGDYIELPAGCLNDLPAGSITAWVKTDALSTQQKILWKGWPEYGASDYVLAIDNGEHTNPGSIGIWTLNSPGFWDYIGWSNSVLDVGSWTYIAHTWDGMNQRIYLNGQLEEEFGSTRTLRSNLDEPIIVGGMSSTGSNPPDIHFTQGAIDDIRIYNFALLPEEIESQFRDGLIELSLGSIDNPIGDNVLVPLYVTFPAGEYYRSAELNFSGYFEGLGYAGIVTEGSLLEGLDWYIEDNEDPGNMLLTAFAGATEIQGTGIFCYLEFTAIGDICTTVPINIEYAKFNSNEWVESTNGGVTIDPIPDYGDVDQNTVIEALDASDILLYLLDDTYLECQGIANADTYLDGMIDAMDASVILQFLVGDFTSLPVSPSPDLLAAAMITGEDQEAVPNALISIPFHISEAENIYAFEGTLTYDPDALTISEQPITWSSLLSGFMKASEVEPGVIHFVGAGEQPDGAEGVFFTVNVILNPDSELCEQTMVTLETMKFNSNLVLHDISATIDVVVSVDQPKVPTIYSLEQNYPNPFNPSTTIRYGLPEEANVSLVIYDVRGQVVQTLESEHQPAGWYDVVWDGQTTEGKAISTGIYFARLVARDYSQVVKMLYLK